LEILSGNTPLVSMRWAVPAGSVRGDTLTLFSPEPGAFVQHKGQATSARLISNDGTVVVPNLSIGTDVILDKPTLEAGQVITIPNNMNLRHA
jgi:hypothetical protein